ncbi:uncharacterized protein LODBEIA_P14770 [Lodderomyces beijingensis]|uniref:Pyruvate decarboxylase n=1 Tax=Lodderomyces beijingensis TaxID=1775926 RepID=A0ABP0ZGF9_9ASCO
MPPVQLASPQVFSPTSSGSITPMDIPKDIFLGEYIFYRITEANPKLKSVFEIPGDFNLDFLEHAYSPLILNRGVKLINTCNELNGAYTADGYARVIDGLSVFISTFGVGELSAVNGIAGAFAEYSPVLHIVGTTALETQEQAKSKVENIHHLVPNHDICKPANHNVYKEMIKDISCVQESLTYDMNDNVAKIDRVLNTILQERRPGYLFIPRDVPNLQLPSQLLFSNPFSSASKYEHSLESEKLLKEVTDTILSHLYQSENPSVFSDCLTTRFGAQRELDLFLDQLPQSIKIFSSNFGRNVNETKPNYVGVYDGKTSSTPQVRSLLESSDFVLGLGVYETEMNNAAYSADFSNVANVVMVHPDYIRINSAIYHIKQVDGEKLFSISQLLVSLATNLDAGKITATVSNTYTYQPKDQYIPSASDVNYTPQSKLTDHFNSQLEPNDLFIVDTMSFVFGLPDIKFPAGAQLVSASAWGSIGYALPATFGATCAINDLGSNRRIVLVQGDGGAQMTIQELSSFVRYHTELPNKPHIYLINNDGYTIERKILGPNRSYNDINGSWKWGDLLSTFGGKQGKTHDSFKIANVEEFDRFFDKAHGPKKSSSRLQFYEIIAGKYDAPLKVDSLLGK